jgi:hypothetical protein
MERTEYYVSKLVDEVKYIGKKYVGEQSSNRETLYEELQKIQKELSHRNYLEAYRVLYENGKIDQDGYIELVEDELGIKSKLK